MSSDKFSDGDLYTKILQVCSAIILAKNCDSFILHFSSFFAENFNKH